MTQVTENQQKKINMLELFSKASKIKRPREYLTEDEEKQYSKERVYDGIIRLKKELLGGRFIKKSPSKTLDDIAKALFKLDFADSFNEARDIVPRLVGKYFAYTDPLENKYNYLENNKRKCLSFDIEKSSSGDVRYRVEIKKLII